MHLPKINELPKTESQPIKVLQFGAGNFLRGFADWMIQVLNEEAGFNAGVVVVKPTNRGDYKQLISQDGLFTVVLHRMLNGKQKVEKKRVACIQKIVNPYQDWNAYLALAEFPGIRFVISNTTEAGIRFNPADNFDDSPPREFPAKLTVWLYHRYRTFGNDLSKGCIFLPCELIENNGMALKSTILQYADHWRLPHAFKEWIHTANLFYNTLVDRIVSGYPHHSSQRLQQELGYKDDLLVSGEYYHSWMIQGPKIIQSEIPFTATNLKVRFVKDLTPYRRMKVRVLNGAHTVLVPVAYLYGKNKVHEALENAEVRVFLKETISQEVLPTMDFCSDEVSRYFNDILGRFSNPSTEHALLSISLNSIAKYKTRVLPSVLDYLKKMNALPSRLLFSLAALIAFYKGERNGVKIPLNDDRETLAFFKSQWTAKNIPGIAKNVLANTAFWGRDLTKIDGIEDMVSSYLENIMERGIKESLTLIRK